MNLLISSTFLLYLSSISLLISSIFLLYLSSISLSELFIPCLRDSIAFIMTVFHFFRNRVFKSFCRNIAGIWCFHVVFQIVGGILALAPAHLFLQMLSNGSSLRWVFFYWISVPCYPGITLPAVLACCRQAIRTKGLPSLCTHHLSRPAVPTPAEMEEFKPRKKEGGGDGFQAESWDGVAGERG